MLRTPKIRKPLIMVSEFMRGEAAGGIVLMGAAALALIAANSPLAARYFHVLHIELLGMSALHWINDGLMAVFFLLVGLEIKREMLVGQLSSWPQRILPGIGAFGGMLVPALIFLTFTREDLLAIRGWAIPTATDIAFALGVLSLLGKRVPISIKVFLTALAIIDDLGAVAIIAVFYSAELSTNYLLLSAGLVLALIGLNRFGVKHLLPYLALGALLWYSVLHSGVHATLAGVALALTIPADARDDLGDTPLITLEHALHRFVPFLILPLFGFANAGVSFAGLTLEDWLQPLTLGIALGLLGGKVIGVFGFSGIAIALRMARLPQDSSWTQLFGMALLCGIGFTMSLFISLLAYAQVPQLQAEAKIGILSGSLLAGLVGFAVLRVTATAASAKEEVSN